MCLLQLFPVGNEYMFCVSTATVGGNKALSPLSKVKGDLFGQLCHLLLWQNAFKSQHLPTIVTKGTQTFSVLSIGGNDNFRCKWVATVR